ncbi:MAG: hypothetical protein P8L74_05540 [Gammaproteobacteria bacterium]|nr:hypothetical protein [Gammaproteobacteria bacterium]
MSKFLKTTIQVITVLAVISIGIGIIIYFNVSDEQSTTEAAQETEAPADTQSEEAQETDAPADTQSEEAQETEAIIGKTQYSSSNTLIFVLAIGLILSLIILLLLPVALYKLYRWRIRIEGGRSIVMPEVHYEKIEAVESGVQSIGGLIQKFGNYLSSKETETEKKFEEFLSLLSKLQNTVETQDAEIARLKEGYDNKLKKDSVMTLIKLRDRVEYFINTESSSEDLIKASNGMLTVIDHELNAMDVLSFNFDSGVSIREIDNFEIIEAVETADQEKIGVVIRTTNNGYYMKGQDDEKIILRKAEIECYKEE